MPGAPLETCSDDGQVDTNQKSEGGSEMQRAVPAQINSDTFTSRFSPALVKSN